LLSCSCDKLHDSVVAAVASRRNCPVGRGSASTGCVVMASIRVVKEVVDVGSTLNETFPGEDSEWFSDFRVVFDEAAVEIAKPRNRCNSCFFVGTGQSRIADTLVGSMRACLLPMI